MATLLEGLEIPLPNVNERDLAGYWEGVAAKDLRVQRVKSTGRLQWPPRGSAVGLADYDLEWVSVPSTGTLFTWTVVSMTGLPGYSSITPYAVGVVQLDEVPVRMLGFVAEDPSSLVPDEPLMVSFVEVTGGQLLPVWGRGPK